MTKTARKEALVDVGDILPEDHPALAAAGKRTRVTLLLSGKVQVERLDDGKWRCLAVQKPELVPHVAPRGARRTLPYAKGSATSKAAAQAARRFHGTCTERILKFVAACGADGATCAEACEYLGMKHQTCSPRFNELAAKGEIWKSGRKRSTDASSADVYVTALVYAET